MRVVDQFVEVLKKKLEMRRTSPSKEVKYMTIWESSLSLASKEKWSWPRGILCLNYSKIRPTIKWKDHPPLQLETIISLQSIQHVQSSTKTL